MELRISEDEMIARIRDSVPRRTAKLLLKLHHELGESEDGSARLVFPFPRRQLALMIGTSPETLSRTLRTMADNGVLSMGGRQVRILDMAALESLASDESES